MVVLVVDGDCVVCFGYEVICVSCWLLWVVLE